MRFQEESRDMVKRLELHAQDVNLGKKEENSFLTQSIKM